MHRLLILLALLPTVAHARPIRIIHILNHGYVSPEDFAIDLKDQDSTLTQKQIDEKYSEFLEEVEAWQTHQMFLFRELIELRKCKSVYIEGLTEKNYKEVMNSIESLREYEKTKEDPPNPILEKLARQDRLIIGAAGQLVVKGELEALLIAEDAKSFEVANPIQRDGSIKFGKEAKERREDAIVRKLINGGIVRRLLKGNEEVVIVLGKDHDLSDNLKQFGSGVSYIRVKVILGRVELKKLKAIHKQFLVLQEKKASDAEWTRFEKRAHSEIDPIVKRLQEIVCSDYPHLQLLYWAGRDGLFLMLKDSRTEKNRGQKMFERYLNDAERIIVNLKFRKF